MRSRTKAIAARAMSLSVSLVLLVAPPADGQRAFAPLSPAEARARESKLLAEVNEGRKVKLTHFDVKSDVQELLIGRIDTIRSEGRILNTSPVFAPVVDRDADPHTIGYLEAKVGVSSVNDGSFGKGVLVGWAHVSANVPSLFLNHLHDNAVWIYKSGNTWTARIDKASDRELKVTRYKFRNLPSKGYVDDARWDWERGADPEAPLRQVMGFPCGKAWCLVGTLDDVPPDGDDPLDPQQGPHLRRFPGWFDRAIDPRDQNRTVRVFPAAGLEANTPGTLTAPTPVAFIGGSSTNATTVVLLQATSNPLAYSAIVGSSLMYLVTPYTMDPLPPPTVRWGSPLVQNRSLITGEIWMRCPNGCCDATIAF